jgi:hypothetical protein
MPSTAPCIVWKQINIIFIIPIDDGGMSGTNIKNDVQVIVDNHEESLRVR